jgi:hypothetical protein
MSDSKMARAIVKFIHEYADDAMNKEWWKPLDVSMNDAREIAQDALRVMADEIRINFPEAPVGTQE